MLVAGRAVGDTITSQADPAVVRMMQAPWTVTPAAFTNAASTSTVGERQRAGGWTPLICAALYGDAEAVRLLLAGATLKQR